jgi:hypothetical protein
VVYAKLRHHTKNGSTDIGAAIEGTMETSMVRRAKLVRILKDYEGGGTG